MHRFMLAFVFVIIAAIPSFAQLPPVEPATNFGGELNLWGSLKEDFLDEDGDLLARYDYRLAPVSFQLGFGLSHALSVNGKFVYSHLFSPDNPPTWAFSTNYTGSMMEIEGALQYRVLEGVVARGGITHTWLERDIVVGPRNASAEIQTTHTSPFAGVAVDASHVSKWIARGYADLLFFTATRDTYFDQANSTTSGVTGFKAGGQLGYMFMENLGVFGSLATKRLKVKDGNDGPDRGRKLQTNLVGVGVEFRF